MKKIALTNGGITFVSNRDYTFLSQFNWYSSHGYATRTTDKVAMHRLIKGVPRMRKGDIRIEVDHKDTDRLNNQRSNLRFVTSSQNKMNNAIRADNTSGFKGVSWDKKSKAFAAYIWTDTKKTHLGYFETAVEAAKAYNKVAKKRFGKYSRPNEIGGVS